MSAPKSVTKVSVHDGMVDLDFTSDVDATQYYLYELSRAAMRDVGKFVKKAWQVAYNQYFGKHSGNGSKATTYKVIAGKSTQYPRVQIGLPVTRAKKNNSGFYSYFQEFGSSKTPRLGLLRGVVNDSIKEIVRIESKYLSGLEGSAAELDEMIDEEEYEDNEDE